MLLTDKLYCMQLLVPRLYQSCRGFLRWWAFKTFLRLWLQWHLRWTPNMFDIRFVGYIRHFWNFFLLLVRLCILFHGNNMCHFILYDFLDLTLFLLDLHLYDWMNKFLRVGLIQLLFSLMEPIIIDSLHLINLLIKWLKPSILSLNTILNL